MTFQVIFYPAKIVFFQIQNTFSKKNVSNGHKNEDNP